MYTIFHINYIKSIVEEFDTIDIFNIIDIFDIIAMPTLNMVKLSCYN